MKIQDKDIYHGSALIPLGNKAKRFIAPLVLAGALAVSPQAKGELIWNWYNDIDANNVIGEVQITNDNDGATYDNYQLTLGYLADAIFTSNQTRLESLGYTSGSDLVSNGLFDYSVSDLGEVYTGWSPAVQGNGDVSITHIDGDPNVDYSTWDATQQAPSQDMQQGTLNINNFFLDLNGDGYNPATDLNIANGTESVVGGIGYVDALNQFNDYTSQITVQNPSIPEPATGLLIALGAAGLAARSPRRRNHSHEG